METGRGSGLCGRTWKASHESDVETEIERYEQENSEGEDVPVKGPICAVASPRGNMANQGLI